MNGLTLRISSGSKKCKNTMSLPPVIITNLSAICRGAEDALVDSFLKAATADEQLAVLRRMLQSDPVDGNVIKLLAVVFFHSEAKHPVKCFLVRHITKTKALQEPFIEFLTSELNTHLKSDNGTGYYDDYKPYKEVVSKVANCIENFPTGMCAVKNVEEQLAQYLTRCLLCCVKTLQSSRTISPTENNEIYSLAHLTLRLMLHIITKNQSEHDEDHQSHIELVKQLQRDNLAIINKLLEDRDVPMDTKSVCGIVLLSMDTYSVHPPFTDAWKQYLDPSTPRKGMSNEQVQLAIYSAIITTVPMHRLQEPLGTQDTAAICVIIQKFTDIIESKASDGVLILGVCRALVAAGRGLPALAPRAGAPAAKALLQLALAHLDHYMDSVRHLAAQTCACALQYCAAAEETGGEGGALRSALAGVAGLGVESRGFLAACAGLARALGAGRVLREVAPLPRLLAALPGPHHAAATSTLETLLEQHARSADAAELQRAWARPLLAHAARAPPAALPVLERLLAKAVKLEPALVAFILPYVREACSSPDRDLRRVIALLSAARATLAHKLCAQADNDAHNLWRGIISYDVLEEAVVDANDETRLQCLSLVCGAAGRARGGEAALVLRYVRYNVAERSPHARTRALAEINKFIKRVEDGLRAARRRGDDTHAAMCSTFLESLRQLGLRGLQRGGNHARRHHALQLLVSTEPHDNRSWRAEDVDSLLQHLDDSYENNKALALHILLQVPLTLIQDVEHSVSVRLEDVLRQSSALQPAECVSAAYKLQLMWRRLPQHILRGNTCYAKEPALYTVLHELNNGASAPHDPRGYDPLHAPRDRPTYGPLYCIAHLLDRVQPEAISDDPLWQQLLGSIIETCCSALHGAGAVVNHAAPEGHVCQDTEYSDYGNNAGVTLDDGRQVTAQMVLLCAWRTVKEATAVLGSIGSRALLPGWLSVDALAALAASLHAALHAARHRGAFEQAYINYQRVLHRMWRDPREDVRSWPALQLKETLAWLRAGAATPRAADRRSAGLPYLVQALVSTEPSAGAASAGLGAVMHELLQQAECSTNADTRAHACNMLRALYRDSSLDTAVQGYVGEGLRVALKGFEGPSWQERNSSTLLLSALMTRVFGVSRDRKALSARNRMTGRVFYLRYPQLYDVMLNKLKEASESESKQLLCPSLYPVLLLLARLYPSSLEGTESNLKLVSFVPLVVCSARARDVHTRRLAAAAAVSLVPADRYVSHVCRLLALLSPRLQANCCHGLLLQLCALLDNKPSGVDCRGISGSLARTRWLLPAANAAPCYPVLEQYATLLTKLLESFPEAVEDELMREIESPLRALVRGGCGAGRGAACGRGAGQAACVRLLLLLLHRRAAYSDVADLVLNALEHSEQMVCNAALDYLLALHGRDTEAEDIDENEAIPQENDAIHQENDAIHQENEAIQQDNEAQENGAIPSAEAVHVLPLLRARSQYLQIVTGALSEQAVWRLDPQRALKLLEVLVCEGAWHALVALPPPAPAPAPATAPPPADVTSGLASLLTIVPENTTHLYLEALTRLREEGDLAWLGAALGAAVACSAPRHAARTRRRAAAFLARHAATLMERARHMPETQAWAVERGVVESVSRLLQDELPAARLLAAAAVQALLHEKWRVVPSLAVSRLAAYCGGRQHATALLTAMALCDQPLLHSHPPTLADECRVFEPNEKYNEHGEETLWAGTCAGELVRVCARRGVEPLPHVVACLQQLDVVSADTRELVLSSARGEGGSNERVDTFVRVLRAGGGER